MVLTGLALTLVDIIIYVLLIVFLIFGLIKGMVKMVFSMMKGVVALVITYILTGPTTKIFYRTNFDESLIEGITNSLIDKAPSLANAVDANNYANQIFTATEEAGIPQFIGRIISNLVKLNDGSYSSVGEALATSITTMIIAVIAFVLVLILLIILINVLARLFSYLITFSGLKTIDRILGMILNGIYGFVLISLVFMALSVFVSAIPSAAEFVDSFIYPSGYDENSFSIAKWLYENNPMKFILESLVGV